MTEPSPTAEQIALQRVALRLAQEIALRELADARLASQTAEIAQLRTDLETLSGTLKSAGAKSTVRKRR